MAIKDYWVYQQRDCIYPWALYVVKEYDKRKKDATVLDYTIYSENIDKPTHSVSFVGIHCDSVSGYVNDIICNLVEFSSVTSEDKEQLEKAILDILID